MGSSSHLSELTFNYEVDLEMRDKRVAGEGIEEEQSSVQATSVAQSQMHVAWKEALGSSPGPGNEVVPLITRNSSQGCRERGIPAELLLEIKQNILHLPLLLNISWTSTPYTQTTLVTIRNANCKNSKSVSSVKF